MEQLKLLMHAGPSSNNNEEEPEDAKDETSSLPTYRRHPDVSPDLHYHIF